MKPSRYDVKHKEAKPSHFALQRYVTAYDGILTSAELEYTELEAEENAADIKGVSKLPRGLVRQTLGRLPDGKKEAIVAHGVVKAHDDERDYSGIVGEVFDPVRHKPYEDAEKGIHDYTVKLNYQQFRLSKNGERLLRLENAEYLTNLFKPGEEKTWPTLVLVSNSNMVSPQSFFDSFSAAKDIVPKVTVEAQDSLVVAGTYFSQHNMNANALDTIRRYRELGVNPESLEKTSPAAQVQAYQLLDLLIERDSDGAVIVKDNKPLLRPDAEAVLDHVIGYGYSAAHMTNKDAFRLLRDILVDGDLAMQVKTEDGRDMLVRDSDITDANRLIGRARLIGVAGMDRMDIAPKRSMPREVNFVSPGDLSLALNGPRFLKAPNILEIKGRDGSRHSLEKKHGGHDQNAYVSAIMSYANDSVRDKARGMLNGRGAAVG